MTKSFSASVRAWSEKAKRNTKFIVMEASEGVYNAMTERQSSIKESGTFVVGKVPVDTGFLVGSAQIEVNGSVTGRGGNNAPPDFMGAIAGFEIGEPIQAAFTAEYAAAMNYGTANMPGRFFVNQAIAQWPAFVAAAARRYKD